MCSLTTVDKPSIRGLPIHSTKAHTTAVAMTAADTLVFGSLESGLAMNEGATPNHP